MSDVDETNNELCSRKREFLLALEAALIELTNLRRDLLDAERKAEAVKSEVGRAECRLLVARTRYQQAEMAFTSYREDRAKARAEAEKTFDTKEAGR